ncbi:MAG: hypothetical protein COS07_04185, partial [Candidatus Aenigmarchaeota archaeon CG01_land_8_20_14_3_00_37_9]
AESGRISHAYLFCGQEKLGKKTIALEWISSLFGQDLQNAQHPDLIFLEPTDPPSVKDSKEKPTGKKEIRISQIRELIWKLSLKPYSAPYKAVIIDQAHLMNQDAQTSLLKTLEEPKGKTFLILITEMPESLFPTIRSRVENIKFYPVKKEEIKNYLKKQYQPDVLLKLSFYSLSIIWGIGVAIVIYTFGMSWQRLKIRNEIKLIEDEFQIALFTLADVLSSGIPIETALEEVALKYRQSKMEKSPMYNFFVDLLRNMKNMGMTLERAVFDKDYGAILRFPSKLVHDIMKIIVSGSKKSSEILSVAARSISDFLSKTKNIESLLKELLDGVASAIQLQAVFIAPFICAIVATMATFIVELLQKVSEFIASIEESFNMGGTFVHGGTVKIGDTLGLINIEQVMPPTLFQLIVGIYMVEVVVILAYFLNGIKNGFDITTRNVTIGKSLISALILYSILLIVSLFLAKSMFPAIGGGL